GAGVLDHGLAPSELATGLESHASRPPGNGLVAGDDGRVIVTDVEGHALWVTAPSGQTLLVQDPRLQWPDGLARGPDDWVYVTANQLDLHPALNRGEEQSRPPYLVLRARAPGPRSPVPVRDPRAAGTPVGNPTDAGAPAAE